ncbi:helix-turn-helix domain-containing protein [Olivibacter sp. XZL3]|uniref:helix-turn-helix domain-containing protein n=1 Tax=Olivibacter sp. XZL3 TaxID=1735116 RepID=UPI00106479B4|nr:helix-turn-helix domain-containing protein [Olivibacter sp. XZL3]
MSNFDAHNTTFAQAVSFINHTNRPVFLTGKAGTGKTTFLRYIKEHTHKKLAVVAPTGVAAINAGGTTLHSLFFLPFGMYLADYPLAWDDPGNLVYNKQRLFGKIKLTKQRRAILQELDLLIIDEVSMLRADTLDAIDAILRWARRNAAPFGGVQMLFIGDLYQLPPVVKGQEQPLLYQYYKSPFFFDAHVMQEVPPVLLELNKVYRQKDTHFISLLNNIRNNCCSMEELNQLNRHYQPDFRPGPEEAFITLSSHNHIAEQINQRELDALPGSPVCFEAAIKGDFSEHSFPTDGSLYLKEGAQIMFIKNDKGEERRYFNGKIGVIVKIDARAGEIKVRFPGEQEAFTVEQEEWKNLRYNYDKQSDKISEETLGTFKQYPIRLAWAVTIHKSQGLTFDKAVIDAGSSFAAGQVYVALSRLTRLEGLVLRSKITQASIHTDPHVVTFSKGILPEEEIAELLLQEQKAYLLNNLSKTFFWSNLTSETNTLKNDILAKNIPDKSLAYKKIGIISSACNQQFEVAEKFKNWLNKQFLNLNDLDIDLIHERTTKAATWFLKCLEDELIAPLKQHIDAWAIKKKNKKYQKELADLLLSYQRKREQIKQSTFITQAIRDGRNIQDVIHEVTRHQQQAVVAPSEKETKKSKTAVGETKRTSLSLFKKGHSIEEIASLRGLTSSTVITHLISFIGSDLTAAELMPASKLEAVIALLKQHPEKSITEIRELLNRKVEFHEIRIAQAALRSKTGNVA